MRGSAVSMLTVLLAAGAGGVSCGGGITTVSQLPATVTLRLAQQVLISPANFRLQLDEIVLDSRCPVDVVCIQAGSVNLRFSVIQSDGGVAGFFLYTEHTFSSLGVVLRITGVAPDRHAGVVIDPRDYRITLAISALGAATAP